ncbi:MAG TPA: sulfite exporter TauE/SafE family protein [Candidatus Paceibacterota bacterium]
MKTYIFHVNGMHCQACELMTESEIAGLPYITRVKSSLKNKSMEVVGDFGDKSDKVIAEELSKILAKHGYSLSLEKPEERVNWSDFKIAVPIALAFIALFIGLQKMGIVNLVSVDSVSYGTAFVIGIIASLSTCMAVVGGLVLSMSATFAKEGDRLKPQILFHAGRIISFFILGGIIGMIGSAFTLNTGATFILGLVIGLVMLTLGINLLNIFHSTKRFQLSMPKFISKHALGISKFNHTLTPLIVGVATFFLPCGFTQSMQIYTLGTGGFLEGGFTMLAFALGTFPVLALLSFSSFNINKSKKSGIFFKTAGLVVILFAIFNIINSFVIIGLIPPIFNF